MDQQVAVLIEYDRIRGPTGSIAVREKQSEERSLLNETIDAAYIQIDGLQKDLTPLLQEKLAIEVEVGPLKYIAELIYGDQARDFFDEAVRWVILLIVFVFDPLAVLLLIAANMTLTQSKSPKPLREVEAVVVGDINEEWLTETVQVEEDEQIIDSKDQLKSMLKDVDQKLVDLYTHRNTLENKQEKRSLQRLKKKIIDKLNNEESNE